MKAHGSVTKLLDNIQPTFASFAAGIFLSTATNLYTDYLFDNSCGCFLRIFLSALLFLVGACLLTVVSFALQEISELTMKNFSLEITADKKRRDKRDVIAARGWRLSLPLAGAALSIIAGLAVLGWKQLDQRMAIAAAGHAVPSRNTTGATHSK
jgi:hypothetical protein